MFLILIIDLDLMIMITYVLNFDYWFRVNDHVCSSVSFFHSNSLIKLVSDVFVNKTSFKSYL